MMRKGLSVLMIAGLLSSSTPASAGWPVVDEVALVQRGTIWVQELAQWGESIGNQVKQIETTYNVIIQQVRQYESMVQNLQRIPQGLNMFQVIQGLGHQVSGLLNNANIVSYDVGRVLGQFDGLYQQVGTLSNPGEVMALRHRMLTGRMEASQVTVQVTAIQGQLTELYTRICALLNGAHMAHGNLDIQQIQAQQNGLLQHTMQAMAAMQAAHARNTAQAQAEQAALERVQLQAIEGAMGSAKPLGEPQGKLPRFHW